MNNLVFEAAKKVMNDEGYLIDPDFCMVAIRVKTEASELMNDILLISTSHKTYSYSINTIPCKKEILSSGQYTYIKAKNNLTPYYGQQRSSVVWTDKEGFPKSDEYEARLKGFNLLFSPFHWIPGLSTRSQLSGQSKGSQIVSSKAYFTFKEYAPPVFLYTIIDLEDIEKVISNPG